MHPRNLFEDDRITTLGCQVGNVLQIQGARKWENVARNMRSVVHWDPLLPSFLDFYALRPQFDSLSASALTLDWPMGVQRLTWLDLYIHTSIIRYKLQLYHCMGAETPWANWAPVPTGADWTGDCHELHWIAFGTWNTQRASAILSYLYFLMLTDPYDRFMARIWSRYILAKPCVTNHCWHKFQRISSPVGQHASTLCP